MAAMTIENFTNWAILDGSLQQVPWIGPDTEEKLREHGIKTVWQLFGKHLKLGRNVGKLASLLRECGVNAGNVNDTANAIDRRVRTRGINVTVPLSESMRETSKLTGPKRTEFVNKKLSGSLQQDFLGVGETTVKKMNAAGVTTSDELFAQFLALLDEPTAQFSTAPGDAFYGKLSEYGVSGYKSSVVDCILTKLEQGIDSGR